MDENPRAQVIIASRPWAAIRGKTSLFPAQLLPFTKDQVSEFFQRWFAGDPRHATEIEAHLQTQPGLYSFVATPLVATIFAVVKTIGGKLPSSLLEVYEERLRLLLHDWDAIKGVKRDAFDENDKRFFLRRLAYELHDNMRRSTEWTTLVKTALAHLGGIRDSNQAERLVRELSVDHNNVLFQDPLGNWSLGHLQYQEYLAALEAKENPRIDLSARLSKGWWANVLRFYAEMTRDITGLAEAALRRVDQGPIDDEQNVIAALLELIVSFR